MWKSGGCKLTKEEWAALQATDISELPAAAQQRRLRDTDLWYQSGFTWAIVALAQVIRSRLSATYTKATLYFVLAQDYVLNRASKARVINGHVAEHVAAVPNMNTTAECQPLLCFMPAWSCA